MARDNTPDMSGFGYIDSPRGGQAAPTHEDVVAAARSAAARAATYRSADPGFAAGSAGGTSSPKRESDILSVTEVTNIANSILKNHTFHVMGEVSELSDKPGYKAVFTVKDEGAGYDVPDVEEPLSSQRCEVVYRR